MMHVLIRCDGSLRHFAVPLRFALGWQLGGKIANHDFFETFRKLGTHMQPWRKDIYWVLVGTVFW